MKTHRQIIRRLALAGALSSLPIALVSCGGEETVSSSRTAITGSATSTIPSEVAMTDGASKGADVAKQVPIDEKTAEEPTPGKGDANSGPLGADPSGDQGASNDDGPPESTGADPAAVPARVADDGSLPEGRSLVFVHEVLPDEGAVVVDLAQYFEGPAADRAARADGAIGPNDQVDGGHYVRNVNSRLRTVAVRAGTVDLMELASTMSSTRGANPYFVSVAGGWITDVSPANLGTS